MTGQPTRLSAMMKLVALLLTTALLGTATVARADSSSPVVAELFTSEGCSSCPPADALLSKLRERKNIIALAYHVDYWNYLGWKDRFSQHVFTMRQRAYARALGSPMVYTPQLVIDGETHVVGSNKAAVDAAIAQARASGRHMIDIGLSWSANRSLVIKLPPSDRSVDATIWFVRFEHNAETLVTAGENAGRLLKHANIVDELAAIGMWDGSPLTITLPWEAIAQGSDPQFGCAILVQPEGLGPILGARQIDWGPSN